MPKEYTAESIQAMLSELQIKPYMYADTSASDEEEASLEAKESPSPPPKEAWVTFDEAREILTWRAKNEYKKPHEYNRAAVSKLSGRGKIRVLKIGDGYLAYSLTDLLTVRLVPGRGKALRATYKQFHGRKKYMDEEEEKETPKAFA